MYEQNSVDVAFARLSLDPKDNQSIWIDEFEVLHSYRRTGIGKKAVAELVAAERQDFKIMAKNRHVQIFWEKCGFEDDGISWDEIPMIYYGK